MKNDPALVPDAGLFLTAEVYADLKLGKTVYDSLYEAWKTFDQVADFKDSFQVADLMTIPNFLNYTIKEPDENVLQETTLLALSDALESITKMRCNEGEALYSDLSHQLEKLEEINKCIEKRAPVVLEEYSKKLFKKVEEWTGTLETEYKTRLGMEIVLYSDKSDINEEISRLFSHINQFKETLLFQCDIAFIGVGAASSRQGLSTGNITEAALMRQMIDHSDQVVILADSSKLGRGIFARIGPIELADVLVTDKAPDADLRADLDSHGIRVLYP